MDELKCSHCNGSGQEFDRLDLASGEVHFRTCSVCQGSGSVPLDRQYFSPYPDVSLRNAMELMHSHGKPVEVDIAKDDDLRVRFRDGSYYQLGGFTVGYRGTGPDFTKRFLDAAGFSLSIDEIAEMQPPLTLRSGEAYLAPQELLVEAETVENARRKAVESVPAGARLLTLQVVRDGLTPLTKKTSVTSKLETAIQKGRDNLPEGAIIEVELVEDEEQPVLMPLSGEGSTQEQAIERTKKGLPEGASITKTEVVEEGEQTIQEQGDTEASAFATAQKRLPEWATIESQAVVQAGSQGILVVPAFSFSDAKWKTEKGGNLPEVAEITDVHCMKQPRNGFIGLGARPGSYEVAWQSPWVVRLTYRRVQVRLEYRRKQVKLIYRARAAVKVQYQPAPD